METGAFDLVVPTVGRPSLEALFASLAASRGPRPGRVIVVVDRAGPRVVPTSPGWLAACVEVLQGSGGGPAAARNVGWRSSEAEWVAFLDDDVVVTGDWLERLASDLAVPDVVGGSQGAIRVPSPGWRRPTDWERNVAGLESARWATADMAYRRRALESVRGFDERFRRAYREDADLAIRVRAAGFSLVRGTRTIVHPVRPADRWVSVRLQAGNADDARMRALHGPGWRRLVGAPAGRRARHVPATGAGLLALGALALGHRRVAAAAGAAWLIETASFAWARISPGPRTREEVATMLLTSVAIPPVATYRWLEGMARARRLARWRSAHVRFDEVERPEAA